MEKENVTFCSNVIRKSTPIKRLGLSRKRKSCDSGHSLNTKIQACSENFPAVCNLAEKHLQDNEAINGTKNDKSGVTNAEINYVEEIKLLNKRIADEEEKLENLKSKNNNIVQLESLIDLWKTGCKSAFLYFSQLLQERQAENIDFKSILNRLGIWEVMVMNFGSDNEIPLIEYSQ